MHGLWWSGCVLVLRRLLHRIRVCLGLGGLYNDTAECRLFVDELLSLQRWAQVLNSLPRLDYVNLLGLHDRVSLLRGLLHCVFRRILTLAVRVSALVVICQRLPHLLWIHLTKSLDPHLLRIVLYRAERCIGIRTGHVLEDVCGATWVVSCKFFRSVGSECLLAEPQLVGIILSQVGACWEALVTNAATVRPGPLHPGSCNCLLRDRIEYIFGLVLAGTRRVGVLDVTLADRVNHFSWLGAFAKWHCTDAPCASPELPKLIGRLIAAWAERRARLLAAHQELVEVPAATVGECH